MAGSEWICARYSPNITGTERRTVRPQTVLSLTQPYQQQQYRYEITITTTTHVPLCNNRRGPDGSQRDIENI
jgi:hypothetical protein